MVKLSSHLKGLQSKQILKDIINLIHLVINVIHTRPWKIRLRLSKEVNYVEDDRPGPKYWWSSRYIVRPSNWNTHVVIITDYLENIQTTTGDYYLHYRGMLFLQVNVIAHKSQITVNSIWDIGFKLLEPPPYAPDLDVKTIISSLDWKSLNGHTLLCNKDNRSGKRGFAEQWKAFWGYRRCRISTLNNK